MISNNIKIFAIILILMMIISCVAKEETVQSKSSLKDSPVVKVKAKEEGKTTITHLGRDTYKAVVQSSLFNNNINSRLSVEKKALSFCQKNNTRFRSLEWSKLNDGYRLEFRCL